MKYTRWPLQKECYPSTRISQDSSKGKSVVASNHYPALPTFKPPHQQPLSDLPQFQSRNSQNQIVPRNNLERMKAPLDPILVTYSQLLPYLIQNSLVVPKFLNPPNSFPPGYILMRDVDIMMEQ